MQKLKVIVNQLLQNNSLNRNCCPTTVINVNQITAPKKVLILSGQLQKVFYRIIPQGIQLMEKASATCRKQLCLGGLPGSSSKGHKRKF